MIAKAFVFFFQDYPEISMDTVMHLIQHMTASQRAETLKALNNQLPADPPSILQTSSDNPEGDGAH